MAFFNKLFGTKEKDLNDNLKTSASAKQHKVTSIRKYKDSNDTYYEVYKCDDAEAAKNFLATKTVEKPMYYILVETPSGNWGKDIKGLYKEFLLPWQKDVSCAEIDGSPLGIPDTFSLQMAYRGINDNFIIKVRCGSCGHEWIEALCYQGWTVVQCPECGKKNKINSQNYRVWIV